MVHPIDFIKYFKIIVLNYIRHYMVLNKHQVNGKKRFTKLCFTLSLCQTNVTILFLFILIKESSCMFGVCIWHFTYWFILKTSSWSHQKMSPQVCFEDLCRSEYFLGIKVNYHAQGSIILSQSKYIKDLLESPTCQMLMEFWRQCSIVSN